MRNLIVVLLLLGGFVLLAWWVLTGGPGFRAAGDFVRGLLARDRLTPLAIGLFVAVTVGAVATGFFRAGRVDASWQSYASRYGLVYTPRSTEQPAGFVRGTVDGRPVELGLRSRWDFHQRERETWTELSVGLVGAPLEMSVTRRIEMPFDFDLDPGMIVIDGEDEAFRSTVAVSGRDASAVRDWLDSRRREVLAEFVAEEGYWLREGRVAWTGRHAPASVDALSAIHDRLVSFARRLDTL